MKPPSPSPVLSVAGEELTPAGKERVASVARSGGVVVYPAETFYALGADPLSEQALARIFLLKKRPATQPLLVLLDSPARIGRFAASVSGPRPALMERFWPGPLTLLFPARAGLPAGIVSAGGEVALRVPGSALSRAVIRAAGGFLTGTSANLSGAPPPVDPGRAAASLGPAVDLVVDGGTLPGGKVSTLLTVAAGRPEVLRRGAVEEGEIERFLSDKGVF